MSLAPQNSTVPQPRSGDVGTGRPWSLLLCLFVVIWATETSAQEQAEAGSKPKFIGYTKCADCHEKPTQPRIKKGSTEWVQLTEAATWLKNDKHAQAYEQLTHEDVKKWAALIGIKEPTADPRCVSCHCNEPPGGSHIDDFDRTQGVGCESCHGAGSDYKDPHEFPSWRTKTAAEKQDKFGMVDVRNPSQRIRQCLSCHLGNVKQGKILTHQMYAAGPPPLTGFEVETFVSRMPPHWLYLEEKLAKLTDKEQAKTICDLLGYQPRDLHGVKSVVIGGVETLRLSVELAEAQAKMVTAEGGWPDFAQYDCAMCHHELELPSWRQRRSTGGRPGVPDQRVWPHVLVELGIRHVARGNPDEMRRLAGEFRKRFETLGGLFRAGPFAGARDKEKLAAAGHDLSTWLDEHVATPLQACRYRGEEALELLRDLCDLAQGPNLDFDSARQVVWAFDAIFTAFAEKPSAKSNDSVRIRLDKLAGDLHVQLPMPPSAEELIGNDKVQNEPEKKSDYQKRPTLAVRGGDDPDAFRRGFAELAKLLSSGP